MSFKSLLRSVGIRQNSRPELIALSIDVSLVDGSNAGVLEGANYVTVAKNGTGDFTITLNEIGRRACVLVGAVAVGENFVNLQSLPTTSAVRVIVADDAGTEVDADFQCTILVLKAETER